VRTICGLDSSALVGRGPGKFVRRVARLRHRRPDRIDRLQLAQSWRGHLDQIE
jgi:hypothetical protein